MEDVPFANDPGPSTSKKRPSTDEIGPEFKKPKSQDYSRCEIEEIDNSMGNIYFAGGFKRAMRGIMFQLKLLMHFVNHAIDKGYPFRLATEMTAAEKLDDIVIKFNKAGKDFIIFVQAKHKDNIEKTKIKISDLVSTSNNNAFSLLKYFISVCRIKSNEKFQDADQLFFIVTNTDFEFSVYEDQNDDSSTRNTKTNKNQKQTNAIQQRNNEFEKWENFFDKQPVPQENEFFFFEDEDFKAYERKFKPESSSKAELLEIFQVNLLMGAFGSEEIANFTSAKEKLQALIVIYLMKDAKDALQNIENAYKKKTGKEIVKKEAKKVMKLKGYIFNVEFNCNLENVYEKFSKVPYDDKNLKIHIKKVLDESSEIVNEIDKKLEGIKSNLEEFKDPTSGKFKSLEKQKKDLKDLENDLEEEKTKILDLNTFEDFEKKTECDILKKRLPVSLVGTYKTKRMNLNEMKDDLCKRLDKMIADISMIQVAISDDTFDKYLKEFLQQFIFVTKFPNENYLGELINDELKEKYEFLDADLMYASFEKEMLDFLKDYHRGRSKYMEMDEAEKFFKELKAKTTMLMINGLAKAYPDKLTNYGLRFKYNFEQLYAFLSSEDQIFHISTNSTRLSAIKVLQTLKTPVQPLTDEGHKQVAKYKKNFIFVRLRTLLRDGTSKTILDDFENNIGHNLMVIECQSKDANEENLLRNIPQLKTKLKKNSLKKLIVIANDSKSSSYKVNFKYQNDENFFGDLDELSQVKVLEKEVDFQGKMTPLNQLMDTNFAAKVFNSGEILSKLLDETIIIGNKKPFSSIGYVKDYYIKRYLRCHYERVRTEVVKDEKFMKRTLLLITGADKESLIELGINKTNIHKWQDRKQYEIGAILMPPDECVDNTLQCIPEYQQMFQSLSKENKAKNIHWLHYSRHCSSKYLLYRGSAPNSKLAKLRKFGYNNDPISEYIFENFNNSMEKIVLIANDSGMGKSTLLTNVARTIKDWGDAWIVRVNLSDYCDDTDKKEDDYYNDAYEGELRLHHIKLGQERKTEDAVDFLAKIAIPHCFSADAKTDPTIIQLQRQILIEALVGSYQKKPKIILQFDGFDEICPLFEDITANWLKAVAGSQVTQMFVTTRRNKEERLEETFNTPAYILKSLDPKKQRRFLSEFWKWNLKFHKKSHSDRVHERTYEQVIEILEKIKISSDTLLGKQIADILEISQKKCNMEMNDNNLEELRGFIDGLDFRVYIACLLEQWNRSVNNDEKFMATALHLRMLTDVVYEEKFPPPEDMDLFNLFDKFIQIKFNIYYKEKDDIKQTKSVHSRVNHSDLCKLNRVHCELAVKIFFRREIRTVSLPHMNEVKTFEEDLEETKTLKEELLRVGLLIPNRYKHEFIHRSFAEYFISKYIIDNLTNNQVQKLLIQRVFVDSEYELIRKFFNDHLKRELKDTDKLTEALKCIVDDSKKDRFGKTLLHVMSEQGHDEILKFLLKTIEHDDTQLEYLMAKSYEFTPIHSALWKKKDEALKILLEYSLKLNTEVLKRQILENQKMQERSILIMAASGGGKTTLEIVLKFIERNQNKLSEEYLKEFVLCTDDNGETALHKTVDGGQPENVETFLTWVMQQLGRETFEKLVLKTSGRDNEKCTRSQTALQKACGECKMEIVDAILKMVEKYSDKTMLRKLILQTDYFGKTTLIAAFGKNDPFMDKNARKRIIQLLLEYISGPNDLQYFEDLAIISVYGDCRENPWSIVNELLGYFESNNSTENQQIQEILRLIKENIKDVQMTVNKLEEKFFKRKFLEETFLEETFLESEIEEILSQFKSRDLDNERTTRIRVKALVFESKDTGSNRTVLHIAAQKNRKEIVTMLLNLIKDYPRILEELVLKVDKADVETALHRAARYGHHETVSTILNFLEGEPEILKKLFFKKKNSGRSAISLAKYASEADGIGRGLLENLNKTIRVFLESVLENLPEICSEVIKDIGGMQNTLDWTDEKYFAELHRQIIQLNPDECTKRDLFQAAKDGDIASLENFDIQTVQRYLLEKIPNFPGEQTLLDVNVSKHVDADNFDGAFLNWVTNKFQDNPDFLREFFLSCNYSTIGNIQFLKWVKENVEQKLTHILKNLLMKQFHNGKTALSFALWFFKLYKAKEIFKWVQENCDNDTFRHLMLAIDGCKETILHSAISDWHLTKGEERMDFLLNFLESHPDIIKKLILKADNIGETAFQRIEQEMRGLSPSPCYVQKQAVLNRLKLIYDETASSLLNSNTDLSIFVDGELDVLKYYVQKSYNKSNKKEILDKIDEICSERIKNDKINSQMSLDFDNLG